MDWFLYDNGLLKKRLKVISKFGVHQNRWHAISKGESM